MTTLYAAYVIPLLVLWLVYFHLRYRREKNASRRYQEALVNGLGEPATLHPVIDESKCLGCGACVRACPEGQVIGLYADKAVLVEAANCIGHGACKEACPFDAITLVFGTAKRGVEIPEVHPDFQTNVPGIFIAGELGGMGLIKNAIAQGCQAIDGIEAVAHTRRHPELDLLIVGAGPAGLSAALAATEKGLRFMIVEQETFGGTIAHFPRGKIVMTQPMDLPIIGKMRFREVSKEKLLDFWMGVLEEVPMPISYEERVEHVGIEEAGFVIRTNLGIRRAATVLLAIGRRGTPRKLGVQGEDASKVVYRLVDPTQYRGQRVLVVGGGDSALEAAADIAAEEGTTVTLSYRGDGFSRAKPKNRARVERLANRRRINVRLGSKVAEIGRDTVEIKMGDKAERIANDAVIVCAGGLLPTQFLRDIGISVETKYGTT